MRKESVMSPIRAVIGVNYRNNPEGVRQTFYVRRSETMQNYPGVLSLPSIQYLPGEQPDPLDLEKATRVFARMSAERFKGMPVIVHEHLISGSSDENLMGRMVELSLYRISFPGEPELNHDFYTESVWLSRADFEMETVLSSLPCGLCTRLWREYEVAL